MTTYGTIPTASGESSPQGFTSGAKARRRSALAICRPWRELVYAHYFSLPSTIGAALLRIRSNAAYFAKNYIIVLLVIVFLSLLWHPVSLIVFILTMAFWLYLYFLRDEPVVVLGRTIDDRVLLAALSLVTLVLLLLTGAAGNILISLSVGVVVVSVHAAFRRDDYLSFGEEGAGPRGWYAAAEEAGGGRPSPES